jgi:hypothetical protein
LHPIVFSTCFFNLNTVREAPTVVIYIKNII